MATKKTGTTTTRAKKVRLTATSSATRRPTGARKAATESAPKPAPRAPRAAALGRTAPRGGDGTPSRAARERAVMAASAGLEKKAQGIEIVDVSGKVDYADFLVLMTGSSDRHVASIVQSVEDAAKQSKSRPLAVEGMPTAEWVLVDLGDVVVHVFQEASRSLYDIDGLWMDATRVPLPDRAK